MDESRLFEEKSGVFVLIKAFLPENFLWNDRFVLLYPSLFSVFRYGTGAVSETIKREQRRLFPKKQLKSG